MELDLLIIGSGPAGLAAAINAGSEGLHTAVAERGHHFGGQIGETSLMENFIGFPEGITGKDFVDQAVRQAHKFGVSFYPGFEAVRLGAQGGNGERMFHVRSNDRRELVARATLLAIGATYRPIENAEVEAFIGRGIHYGSPPLRLSGHRSDDAIILGAGNSAGQAALHLSQSRGAHVHLIARATHLEDKMSEYLVKRIHAAENITVYENSELVGASGDDRVREVLVRNRETNHTQTLEADQVYLLIGAIPQTGWLDNCDCYMLDERGFILTDSNVPKEHWGRKEVPPLAFESCQPGAFACGDVRKGAITRCASAAGEGGAVMSSIHKYLSERL